MNTQNSCPRLVRNFWLPLFCLCLILSACQQSIKQNPPLPEAMSLGLVPTKQAFLATELLAGHIPAVQGKATEKDLLAFDALVDRKIRANNASRRIVSLRKNTDNPLHSDHRSAMEKLIEQGQEAGVDLLLVPVILSWTNRAGSEAGVVEPAELMMDIFLVDVVQGRIVKRAHFQEQQEALTTNLLNAPAFFSRGGKWVSTMELAEEALNLSMMDFGL